MTCSTSRRRSIARSIPARRTISGTDPFGAPGLFDVAPYWRAAFEPHWGNHWLEVGTFGMAANVHPWVLGRERRSTATFPQTDNYTDVGFDTQYQYQGDNFWLTLRGSYIHEFQNLNASFANGFASNPNNTLNEARAYASLAYGNDNRIVLTGQYFSAWGTPDAVFFCRSVRTPTAGSPRSPTFRSSAAKRRDGRGSTCASGCNTSGTTNSTAPPSAPAPTIRFSSMCGWRCSKSS